MNSRMRRIPRETRSRCPAEASSNAGGTDAAGIREAGGHGTSCNFPAADFCISQPVPLRSRLRGAPPAPTTQRLHRDGPSQHGSPPMPTGCATMTSTTRRSKASRCTSSTRSAAASRPSTTSRCAFAATSRWRTAAAAARPSSAPGGASRPTSRPSPMAPPSAISTSMTPMSAASPDIRATTSRPVSRSRRPKRASTKELITAVALAYEVNCRLIDAFDANIAGRGWDVPVLSLPAVALAAGKLMKLSPDRLEQAVNLAVNDHIPLGQTRAQTLSDWKGIADAEAARNAVFATMLARAGPHRPDPDLRRQVGLLRTCGGIGRRRCRRLRPARRSVSWSTNAA